MKNVVLFICSLAGFLGYGYSPTIDGAEAKFAVRVVDEEGKTIPDARVSSVLYVSPSKASVERGVTDSNGVFRIVGKTIGEVKFVVRKEGFYDSQQTLNLPITTDVKRTGWWAKEEMDVTIVLRSVRVADSIIRHMNVTRDRVYPATNVVMGFDVKLDDWCKPYGRGQYDDFQIRYEFWRAPDDWLKCYSKVEISMTNCVDGLRVERKNDYSTYAYAHAVDTQKRFERCLVLEYDRRGGEVSHDTNLAENQYIVFRSRTKLDDDGNLVAANYGAIMEHLETGPRLRLWSVFNEKANDPVIEDGYAIKGQQRRHSVSSRATRTVSPTRKLSR